MANQENPSRESEVVPRMGERQKASPRIRMLFLTRDAFPTFRSDVDVLFGRELLGRSHEIDFVMQAGSRQTTLGPNDWRGRTVWVGATDLGDSVLHRIRRVMLGLSHDVTALVRLARRDRYDAVQVRNKFVSAVIAMVVAHARGLRMFYWLSFPEPESLLERARDGTARFPVANRVRGRIFEWILYRLILPRCDHAFVQSERMKEEVCRHGIDPRKITPVPMGVEATELERVTKLARVGRAAHAQWVLAYLGTLNPQRRLDVLIDTLVLVRGAGLSAKLLLIGDGEKPADRARLEARAEAAGIREHVEVTGFLPREEALCRVVQADIALSPIFPTPVLDMGSPTKLVEYLGLGLPVVANRHPEQRLILRATRAGVTVPWGAQHFARAILWLAGQKDEVRRAMGERGRAWVMANRNYARIASVVEEKYLDLLKNAR